MKKINLKYMLWMLFILILSSCKDEIAGISVEEGLSTKLNLSIEVPEAETIANTRSIADNESRINQLALLFYSENSNLNYGIDLSDKLVEATSTGDGFRKYSLKEAINVQTGTFRIYAIANWASSFANNVIDINSLPTEDDLKLLMAQNNKILQLPEGDFLPMTDILSNQTIYIDENQNILNLKLKRSTARVEFTITNGDELAAKNGKFTPKTYQIINLPGKSYLFDQENNIIDSKELFSSELMNFEGSNTFEFLMNENVCSKGINITEYTDRDAYSGDWFSHKFTNAPSNSTYVIITGEYEDNYHKATVNYLIHLGNFNTDKDKGGSLDNFTVNRNELHKYNVTINGVNNVSTSVEVFNPGAYSDDKVEKTFEFISESVIQDAHYVIYPIKIKTNVDKWVVKSSESWLTLRTDLTNLEKQGYWIEDDRGNLSIEGNTSGETTIYAFLEENAANNAQMRSAVLTLYKEGYEENNATFEVFQHPVKWIDGEPFGTGFIEESSSDWGFIWNRKVIYSHEGWGSLLYDLIAQIYVALNSSVKEYVNIDYKFSILNPSVTITIDYNNLNVLGTVGQDMDNGLQNTFDLFTFKGLDYVTQMETFLDGMNLTKEVDGDDEINMEEYAVRLALKKNCFVKRVEQVIGEDGQTALVEYAQLKDGTINSVKWFLPSANQYKLMKNKLSNTPEFNLTGNYWTSTASDNGFAKLYNADTDQVTDGDRSLSQKIHCMRVRD